MFIMTILLVMARVAFVLFGGNLAIVKYADWKKSQMAKIPLLLDTNDTAIIALNTTTTTNIIDPIWTPSKLRKTVNKRSELVENLEHRKAWNRWILSPSPSTTILLDPGEYKYAYRSYVNYEEAGGIRKRLWHLPTILWGYVQPTPGTITVRNSTTTLTPAAIHTDALTPAANDTDSDERQGRQEIYYEEWVRFRWRTLLLIVWIGYWDPPSNCIHWTTSRLTTYKRKLRPWNFWRALSPRDIDNYNNTLKITTTTLERPALSEKLRKLPWDLIKVEDGMLAFRRGDVGMLVYDSKQQYA